jgi:hypothetical protein
MDSIRRISRRLLRAFLWRRIAARFARRAIRIRRRPSPVWSFVNIPAAGRVDTVASAREARNSALRPAFSPFRRRSLDASRSPA